MKKKRRPRHLEPIPDALNATRVGRDIGVEELAKAADLSRKTVQRAEAGQPISIRCAEAIAKCLGVPVRSVFRDPHQTGVDPDRTFRLPRTDEWQVEELLESVTAANGLQYFVCRMRHAFEEGVLARGKYYLLAGIRASDRSKRQHELRRHREVCRRVGGHPNVVQNTGFVCSPDQAGWWVIDFWVAGETLEERLANPVSTPIDIERLARDTLAGLAALHDRDIVFRELAPSRILLADDGRAVLTDFELARLTVGAPTVKPAVWKDELYRAPELDSGRFDRRADLYSWARVLARVALGELPPPADTAARIARSRLPEPARGVVARCADIEQDRRPSSVRDVAAAVGRWT
jgi:serine/threonine protein kinase